MATDAVTLITADHRLLESLFARLLEDGADRRAVVEEITARLTAHARAEEQEVYPALEDADPGEEEEVDHAYEEHLEAEHELGKVRNLINSPHFEDAVSGFVAAVRHHVEEEESEVLPALRKAVDAPTLGRLGAAFAKARDELLAQAGFNAPADTFDAAPDTADDALDGATRDELYELAKQADVPGRSGMNKEELAEALRQRA